MQHALSYCIDVIQVNFTIECRRRDRVSAIETFCRSSPLTRGGCLPGNTRLIAGVPGESEPPATSAGCTEQPTICKVGHFEGKGSEMTYFSQRREAAETEKVGHFEGKRSEMTYFPQNPGGAGAEK